MPRLRSARLLAGSALSVTVSLVLLGLLGVDAKLSMTKVSEPRWRLAEIAVGDCGEDCMKRRRLAVLVREELGSFGTDVGYAMIPITGEVELVTLALLDPLGQIIARFPLDAEPRRIASRIRIFLTGRFDPELIETCTLSAVRDSADGSAGIRDRWQKGL